MARRTGRLSGKATSELPVTCEVTYALDLTGLHRPAYAARVTAAAAALWAPSGWRFTRASDGADVTIRFADDGVLPASGAYSLTWGDGTGTIVVQAALADTAPRWWLRMALAHELGHTVGLPHGGDGVMSHTRTPTPADLENARCTPS